MIITIDGPSGTGKTSVARLVAQRLKFVYFDTGAMYRAFTWLVLSQNVDLFDKAAIERLLNNFEFTIKEDSKEKHYFVGGEEVTKVIRSQLITEKVSAVSAFPQVRNALLEIQHRFARGNNAVFEGRDLGTVVFPGAEVKIFLTADPQIRAERRLNELMQKTPSEFQNLSRETLLKQLSERDSSDSTRAVAPLKCPIDALTIDTTTLSLEEAVEAVVKYATSIVADS